MSRTDAPPVGDEQWVLLQGTCPNKFLPNDVAKVIHGAHSLIKHLKFTTQLKDPRAAEDAMQAALEARFPEYVEELKNLGETLPCRSILQEARLRLLSVCLLLCRMHCQFCAQVWKVRRQVLGCRRFATGWPGS